MCPNQMLCIRLIAAYSYIPITACRGIGPLSFLTCPSDSAEEVSIVSIILKAEQRECVIHD